MTDRHLRVVRLGPRSRCNVRPTGGCDTMDRRRGTDHCRRVGGGGVAEPITVRPVDDRRPSAARHSRPRAVAVPHDAGRRGECPCPRDHCRIAASSWPESCASANPCSRSPWSRSCSGCRGLSGASRDPPCGDGQETALSPASAGSSFCSPGIVVLAFPLETLHGLVLGEHVGHVAGVLAFHRRHPCVGFLRARAGGFAVDVYAGVVHGGGHPAAVPADVEHRAAADEVNDVRAVSPQPVLHEVPAVLGGGERGPEVDDAGGGPAGEFAAVEVVDLGVGAPEEQQCGCRGDVLGGGLQRAVCRNPRNGAIPLPAQTITTGVVSAGGWKAMLLGRTVTATLLSGRACAR